jgi:hypothetical protein
VPYVEWFADACIRLYDIDVSTTHLHICVGLEGRMLKLFTAEFEIGCFNLGPHGLSTGTECLALTAVFVVFFF